MDIQVSTAAKKIDSVGAFPQSSPIPTAKPTVHSYKKFKTRIALILFVWIAIGFSSLVALRHFSKTVEERTRVRQIALELDRLFFLLTDAETGQRGYLLTENPKYLLPFRSAVTNLSGQITKLDHAIEQEPTLHLETTRLRALVTAKTEEMQKTVDIAGAEGFAAARNEVMTDRGFNVMNDFRLRMSEMQNAVTRFLNDLENKTAAEANGAAVILAFAFLVALVIMIWGFRQMRQSILRQNAARAEAVDLNRKLETQVSELNTLNSELEAFSYSVSHDLRAPLRHISGFVDLMRNCVASTDAKGLRYLGIIGDSARQMGRLIDDLLIFSRMSRTEMQRLTVPLDPLVDRSLAELEIETKGRMIEWARNPLPAVQGDPSLLYQVIYNLVANAVKYTRPRNPARVRIEFEDRPDEWLVSVSDNGVGFDMQYAGKLFGVFQRLHRAEDFEGTGIGLANVRRIIHRHGGRTWAESKLNEGATFFFTLPKIAPVSALTAVSDRLPKENYDSSETNPVGRR